MALARFEKPDEKIAPYYAKESNFTRIYVHEGVQIRLSVWFDGFAHFPLVETIDASGVATSGKLLRENVRLVKAIKYAEEWINDNLA